MTNQNSIEDRQLDDRLAKFTDQLLDSNVVIDLSETDSDNQTLLELQETVLHLAHTFKSEPNAVDVAQKIKPRLVTEWLKLKSAKPKESLWQGWLQRLSKKQVFGGQPRNRKTSYALAFASLAIIIIFLSLSIFFPDFINNQTLPGTAFGENFPVQAILILGLVIVLLYLIFRNKR